MELQSINNQTIGKRFAVWFCEARGGVFSAKEGEKKAVKHLLPFLYYRHLYFLDIFFLGVKYLEIKVPKNLAVLHGN